jgi:hypothetical protein
VRVMAKDYRTAAQAHPYISHLTHAADAGTERGLEV